MKTVLYTILFVFACAGFKASAKDFEIKTTPEKAEIFLAKDEKTPPVKLGNSPLKLPADEVFSQAQDSKTFILTIKKEGFDTYKIMMVKTPSVDYKLDILLKVNDEIKTIKKHDLLMGELFRVQRLIRSNNIAGAIKRLTELEKDYKEFSVISELKGISYYMQKDFDKSLSMFRDAFSKNSDNSDAYRMKVYLEKQMGLDAEIK